MGETIGSYIRSRRLTQAAWDLIHSKKKILDISISLYYETAESFTRAFKDRYSMTPTEYRKNKIDTLIETYNYIWGIWFPKCGFEFANCDDFEYYTERFLGSDNENSEIDIYFPIA